MSHIQDLIKTIQKADRITIYSNYYGHGYTCRILTDGRPDFLAPEFEVCYFEGIRYHWMTKDEIMMVAEEVLKRQSIVVGDKASIGLYKIKLQLEQSQKAKEEETNNGILKLNTQKCKVEVSSTKAHESVFGNLKIRIIEDSGFKDEDEEFVLQEKQLESLNRKEKYHILQMGIQGEFYPVKYLKTILR